MACESPSPGVLTSPIFPLRGGGAACPACAWEYHERGRLVQHWEKKPACFREVQHFALPMDGPEMEAALRKDKEDNAAKRDNGFRHMRATRPAFPRWGPTLEGRRDHLGTPIPPEAVEHLEPPPSPRSARMGRRIAPRNAPGSTSSPCSTSTP